MYRSTAASRTDPLTGLANRLRLTRVLSGRIADSGPDDPVALLLIDLNRFKQVNDTHGHLIGDRVLCLVAARLQAVAGPYDLVARYGGDEFAVVLAPGLTVEEIAAAAESYRLALVEPLVVDDLRLTVDGSVGVASTADPRMDVLGLLASADLDMYRRKRGNGTSVEIRPTWSITVQGAASQPVAGWAGVRWSDSSGGGLPSGFPAPQDARVS
jgi:diguanylate cyclase (GGDEF)-like protein